MFTQLFEAVDQVRCITTGTVRTALSDCLEVVIDFQSTEQSGNCRRSILQSNSRCLEDYEICGSRRDSLGLTLCVGPMSSSKSGWLWSNEVSREAD
jgi:hypothetical protein